MQKTYSIDEFYLYLKLGIWKSGTVNFWGQVEILPSWNDFFCPMDLHTRYNSSSLIKKHLDIGVYLLDVFHLSSDTKNQSNIYHAIIAICRNNMSHLESLVSIQITNSVAARQFLTALSFSDVTPEKSQRRRSSAYGKRSSRSRLTGNIPVGSRFIRH